MFLATISRARDELDRVEEVVGMIEGCPPQRIGYRGAFAFARR